MLSFNGRVNLFQSGFLKDVFDKISKQKSRPRLTRERLELPHEMISYTEAGAYLALVFFMNSAQISVASHAFS